MPPAGHTRGANFDLINEITLRPSPVPLPPSRRKEGRTEGRTDGLTDDGGTHGRRSSQRIQLGTLTDMGHKVSPSFLPSILPSFFPPLPPSLCLCAVSPTPLTVSFESGRGGGGGGGGGRSPPSSLVVVVLPRECGEHDCCRRAGEGGREGGSHFLNVIDVATI